MKCLAQFAMVLIGAGFVTIPLAAGEGVNGYLDEKGNLTQSLHVKQLQGGFAGDTGWLWKVEKNGAWRKFYIFNQKLTQKGQGNFNANQRKALADTLAKFKLLQLPAKTGKPTVNRQLLTIQFGKKSSAYIFGAGDLLPKPNPKTIAGRFGGIFRTVMQMTKSKKDVPN